MIKLILGGNKSGKSTFAEKLAAESYSKVIYIATSVFIDDEMKKKIALHQQRRPQNWETIEEGYDLIKIIKNADKQPCYLIDCITVYITNLFLKFDSEDKVIEHIKKLLVEIQKKECNIIAVANEVGLSVIQENQLARRFSELAGIVNQIFAAAADEVYFCVAGLHLKLK